MQHGAVIMLLTLIIVSAGAGIAINKSFTTYRDRTLYFADEQINDVVGTHLDVENVHGLGEVSNELMFLYMQMRLRPDSDPIPFDNVLIGVWVNGVEGYYKYDSSIDCNLYPLQDNSSNSIANIDNKNNFGVEHLLQLGGDEHTLDYILQNDLIKICLPLSGPLGADEEVRINIVAEEAGKTILEFRSPNSVHKGLVELYHKLI